MSNFFLNNLNLIESKIIPSNDDERDWILDNYYHNMKNKNLSILDTRDNKKTKNNKTRKGKSVNCNQKNSKKKDKLPNFNNNNNNNNNNYQINLGYYLEIPREYDLSNNVQMRITPLFSISGTLATIKDWLEYKLTNTNNIFSSDFISSNEKISAREALEIIRLRGIMKEEDTLNNCLLYESNDSYLASENKIKGYARIYSPETLKQSLIDFGIALIILPYYSNEDNIFWKYNNQSKLIGGVSLSVLGYNDIGFILRNNINQTFIYPYNDWGCQWDIWTILDLKYDNTIFKNNFFISLDKIDNQIIENNTNLNDIENNNNLNNKKKSWFSRLCKCFKK